MPRTLGARNAQYEARRAQLLERLRERLARADAPYPSYRELVEASGAGPTTLRHYFGGREALIEAVLAAWRQRGQVVFDHLARPSGTFEQSIRDAANYAVQGHRMKELRQLHRVGFSEGLRNTELGPTVVSHLLEPMLAALTTRLEAHISSGEMKPCDARGAALSLISPVIVAFLHQLDLGGVRENPLDIDALVEQHVAGFVVAFRR